MHIKEAIIEIHQIDLKNAKLKEQKYIKLVN